MRVASDHPAKGGGWWHPFTDSTGQQRPRGVRVVTLDAGRPRVSGIPERADTYRQAVVPSLLEQLADGLGVTAESLQRLGVGLALDHGRDAATDPGDIARLTPAACCWSFPMRLADGDIVGVRLRAGDGRKWAVTGGREGLFIPTDLPSRPARLFICEGPTDTAALLSWGLVAIGRPSCTGATRETVRLVQRLKPKAAIIVADADAPGQRGANAVACVLAVYCGGVRIIRPPAGIKDARQWRRAGASADDVMRAADATQSLAINISRRAS